MSETVALPFDYLSGLGAALFPCRAGGKNPIIKWKDGSKHDPQRWRTWLAEGHNLAVDCAKSGLIMLDVDASKVSREQAWSAFTSLCRSWGLSGALPPYCQSARGGWHVPVTRPQHLAATDLRGGGTLVKISDIRPLAKGEKDGEVVGFKNRGYCVAPGSYLDSEAGKLFYVAFPDAPAPAPCPDALLALLALPVAEVQARGATGVSEPTDLAALVAFLDGHNEFDSEPDWFKALGAIKLALGDTDIGLEVARQITFDDATDEAMMSRWNRHASVPEAKPGVNLYTIGSMIKRAETLGRKFRVGTRTRTASEMFGGAAPFDPIAQLAAATGATTQREALIGQNWKVVGRLGQPILDTFLEGTRDLPFRTNNPSKPPLLPVETMSTHPLFESLNSALGRIAVMMESPKAFRQQRIWSVLKVLRWTHEPTYDSFVNFINVSECTLSPGELAKHNKNFEVAIVNEQRAASGPRGFVPGAKNLPDPQVSDNVGIFLGMTGARLQYDEFTKRTELSESESDPFARVDNYHLDKYWYLAKSSNFGFHPSKDLFRTGWNLEARAARSYDSLRDRVDCLAATWDRTPRLDSWLTRCVGVADDLYHQTVGRNLIGGMVRRARHPGCVQAETVIFISPQQGTGKSTLCKILALESDWYLGKYKLGGTEQNSLPLLSGKWVVEMSELAGLNKTDFEDVKTLLTSTKDEYVAKYEAIPTEHLRRCCFIGTSNLRQPLADPSGNRRFLPVHVIGDIDLEWLQQNVEQLIGEAAARETAGESFAIPREVWTVTTEQQEAARNLSPVEEAIHDWFDREGAFYVLAADIRRALEMAGLRAASRYGVFMEKLGWHGAQAPTKDRSRIWAKGLQKPFHEYVCLEPSQTQANGRVEMRARAGFGSLVPPVPVPR